MGFYSWFRQTCVRKCLLGLPVAHLRIFRGQTNVNRICNGIPESIASRLIQAFRKMATPLHNRFQSARIVCPESPLHIQPFFEASLTLTGGLTFCQGGWRCTPSSTGSYSKYRQTSIRKSLLGLPVAHSSIFRGQTNVNRICNGIPRKHC